jgi:hypothetical protein
MEALDLFNDRVARLERSGLALRMQEPHYKLDLDRVTRGDWISLRGVSEDAVDAFVLHVRLLSQDSDGFSIRRLAEDVYCGPGVPLELKQRFDTCREKWSAHTDRRSLLKHPAEDRNMTNGELFDILLYGGLAHANRDKLSLFLALTRSGPIGSFVCVSFLNCLRLFLEVVRGIRDVNKELREHWAC